MTGDEAREFFGTDKRNLTLEFKDVLWCVSRFKMAFEVTEDGLNYAYKIALDNLSDMDAEGEDAMRLRSQGWAYDEGEGCLIIEQERLER